MAPTQKRISTQAWPGLLAGALLLATWASAARGAPRWIRLSWTQDPSTSLTVAWTDDSAGSGQAEIREGGGTPTAGTATTLDTGSSELDVTYEATFTGLSPYTTYEYRVQSSGAWSNWTETRTAPAAGTCAAFRFVAVGDGRGQEDPLFGYYLQSTKWPGTMSIITQETPLFVIHSGDFVYAGDETEQWEIELEDLPTISAIAPFFLSMGNHDDGPGEGPTANFNKVFAYSSANPDNAEDYYSLVMGNLQVVSLCTHSFSMLDQISWLDTMLTTHAAQVDWRVVFFHVPVWSSGAHGSNENNTAEAATLLPVLESHGVDLVISGHDHDYERFHPSTGGHNAGPHVYTPLPYDNGTRGEASGVVYMVTGGAGALINPFVSNPIDGSAFFDNRIHYVVIDVLGNKLDVTVRDLGDYYTLGDPQLQGDLDGITLEKSNTLCGPITDPDGGVEPDGGTEPDAGGTGQDGGTGPDAATGQDGGTGPGPDASSGSSADSGCGCRTTSAPRSSPLFVFFILVLGLGALRRARPNAPRL